MPEEAAWRLALGESVAVSGVCLTVVEAGPGRLAFDLAEETLRVTTLGELGAGDPVNLERPLRLDGRLGGHLVLGHVDGDWPGDRRPAGGGRSAAGGGGAARASARSSSRRARSRSTA